MEKNNHELEKLGKAINKIGKEVKDSHVFLNVKKRLVNTIECGKVVNDVEIEASSKARIREKLIAFASSYSRPRFVFHRFFSTHKKAWAGAFLFIFIFNLFAFVDGGIQVTYAQFTVLEQVQGDVYVERDGGMLPGTDLFELREGDVVITQNKSKAAIKFFDKSISRLHENTEVVLSRLFLNPNTEESNVVLGVREGKVWSRVNEFVSDASGFVVRSADVLAQAKNNSAFNVSAEKYGKGFKVEVFEEEVDVKVLKDNVETNQSVTEGSEVFVDGNSEIMQVQEMTNPDEWITENLDEDETHLEQIIEETKDEIREQAGILPETMLHPIKRIKEDARLLVTFDDAEKAKIRLEIAEKRLFEAEALMSEGDNEKARAMVAEFQAAVDVFMGNVNALKEADPVKYVDLMVYIQTKLNKHKRNLSFINPAGVQPEEVDQPQNGNADVSEKVIKPVEVQEAEDPVVTEDEPEDSEDSEDSEGSDEPGEAAPILDLYLKELDSK